MKVLDVKQGTLEWLQCRLGIVTASEMDKLVTPLGHVREGKEPKTYLHQKLAERWRGAPLPDFGGGWMEQGSVREDAAIPAWEWDHGVTLSRPGFVLNDDGSAGCSPDGMLPDGSAGVEVKCPAPHTHVGYLLGGVLPAEYVLQVQGSLWVTGLTLWHFYSYCPHFPALDIAIEPNQKIQEALSIAIPAFTANLAECYARLIDLNGGEEPKRLTHDEIQAAIRRSWATETKPLTKDIGLARV